MENNTHQHHHHILPTPVAIGIGGTLLFLTIVTVWVAGIDLGPLNFAVAMVVASIKASLVMLFFMNLKYDRKENAVIFLTSFVFLAIFIVLTATDMFFRGDVYVKGPLMAAVSTPSKISKPWISSPALVEKGKELFAAQCVACHGAAGDGKGPAAAALNPPPRNFTSTEGWKNGRKATMVFKTLKEGLPPSAMASYATLPADDRWALAHYVLTLAPNPEKDTPADFAKIGVDPNKESVAVAEAPTISVPFAQKRMAEPPTESVMNAKLYHSESEDERFEGSTGAQIYRQACIQCHGEHGEGAIKVQTLSVNPPAYVTTSSFRNMEAMKSQESFNKAVIQGLPGDLMPGNGELSASDLRELYQYVKSLH